MIRYSEFRDWAVLLRLFTPSILADSMAVDEAVAQRGVRALLWHGIVRETGDFCWNGHGEEPILEWVPLPPGPTEHPTKAPEWVVCGGQDAPPSRGLPVRLWDTKVDRRDRSRPGQAHQYRLRQKRFEEMERIREERKFQKLAKAQKKPKWARRGGARHSVDFGQ
jgi:hypothetical protein